MNFRKCGHPEISEECQSCRHDEAVGQRCKAQAELKAALLQIEGMKKQTEVMMKSADACHKDASVNAQRASEAEAKLHESNRLLSSLQNYLRDVFQKKADEHWYLITSGDGTWDNIEPFMQESEKRIDAKGHPVESDAEKVVLWEAKIKDLVCAIEAALIDGHVSERGTKVLREAVDRTPQESKEFLK